MFGVWVLHAEWILREISFREQCLARQSIHVLRQYLAFGRISHMFHVAVDLNPVAWSPFSRRMEKCAQQMLQSSVLLAMRALGKLDIISDFTWLAAVMMVWGSVTHGNAVEQYTWALSVLIRTLSTESMAYGHAKVEASCLVLHVSVACTLVELRQALRRRKPQRWACRVCRALSVGWFEHVQNLNISHCIFFAWDLFGSGAF